MEIKQYNTDRSLGSGIHTWAKRASGTVYFETGHVYGPGRTEWLRFSALSDREAMRARRYMLDLDTSDE